MKLYLIDYENCAESGIRSIPLNDLAPDDRLHIFMRTNQNINGVLASRLMGIRECVEFHFIEKTTKNYLDFQLICFLSTVAMKNPEYEFVIVSNDAGFDSAVDYWTPLGINITRIGADTRLNNVPYHLEDFYANHSSVEPIEHVQKDGDAVILDATADIPAKLSPAGHKEKSAELTNKQKSVIRPALKETGLPLHVYGPVYRAVAASTDFAGFEREVSRNFFEEYRESVTYAVADIWDELCMMEACL